MREPSKWMNEYKSDYYRMTGEIYKPGIKSLVRRFLFHNISFAFWYRRYQAKHDVFSRYFLFRLSRKYGLEISPRSTIGSGLYIGHPYNITIGEGAKLGNNVNIHKGCTIGRTNRGDSGIPCIGNKVYIGINSTIVGNIRIGDDVLIAPNSYVNFDVPNHSIVLGNPGVIHHRKNATEGYISFLK